MDGNRFVHKLVNCTSCKVIEKFDKRPEGWWF